MNSIYRLRESLYRALSSPETYNDESELFDELMVQKPRLLKLLDVGPRNVQEQRELESGKITVNGESAAVNMDFAKQAIFLSQQLDCSEKYVAGVLHHVMSDNPNIGPVQCMELTAATFHQRRRDLVDCLRFILEATEASELPDAPIVYRRLGTFVKAELLLGPRSGVSESTMARKVFKEIEQLDVLIGKADAARKNAGSNTVVPSGQGCAALGFDVLNARYDSLRYERRYLAVVLCAIARLKSFLPNEIQLLVEWLSSNSSHPLTYYILTAILLIFDPIDPTNSIPSVRQTLATDDSLITFMTKKLEPSAKWKDPGLKATVLLKWTLFLTESRHNDTTLEHRTGFKTEELETQVWNAVQGDTFTYLALAIQHLREKTGSSPSASLLDNLQSDQQDQREVPPGDFKLVFLLALETLVRSLIAHASSELRKIKQRQEDLVLATARTDRNRTASRFASTLPSESEKSEPEPRQDIAMLYTFIGLLFAALPEEKALQFWGSGPQQGSFRPSYQESVESISGRLPAFLQWAVWSTPTQDLTMLVALYDMLCGLANGQQCSELAYNFMARGGGEVLTGSMVSSTSGPSVSWIAIFGLLDSWAVSAANPRSQPQAQAQPLGLSVPFGSSFQNLAASQTTSQQFIIGPKTVLLARSFLRVLSTVVTHSVAVRTTICGHAHFRAIPTLLSLIPLGIPLELKGAIFEALAAFCRPGAGAAGVEICKAVWTLMERLEVINVRMWPSTGVSMATGKGMEVELEQIESAHKSYPATIPFLKLLSTLIHTSKQISWQDQVAGTESLNTIPDSLGQPYRLPGVGPFISFVVDNVFAKIPNREYLRPSDRWETNDLCLCFIERSLASFNLESLISGPEDPSPSFESLIPILVHPGYDIIKRLLTDSQLRSSILSYVVEGLEGFEKGLADEDPFFRNTIVRVLRIVLRVLKIQDIFLDVFIPLLSNFNSSPFVGQVHSRSHFTKIDQALLFGPQYIPAVAAYMAYPSHSELVLLSVKILAKLSLSISSSTLVTLIERSVESERILAGFTQIISTESMDDITLAEEFAEQTTGAGAPSMDSESGSLEQANRLAALDLLIQDTELNRPFPNVAHFLLFGGKVGDQTIQDPHALGARKTSIHILLELVNAGIPRLRGKRKEKGEIRSPVDPLFLTLPGLAERCYRVLYQLCIHPRTSDFTTRYLRTREDFFARQIAKVPAHVPQTHHNDTIQVLYSDSSRVTTNVVSLSSFLRLRSYIFDLVALELHVLTNKGHFKGVSELLDILFGTDFEYEEQEFTAFHEVGQSPMRVIDLFQSLMFDWADSLSVEPISLQYLGSLNLQSCIRRDASGCEIVDRTTLLNLLSAAKRTVHAQGGVATSAQNDRLSSEISYILESCVIENHRRQVSHARVGGFEAWRRLLDLALMKCFDRLPHNRRENMLFDLLHVLPVAIRSANVEESTAILLSETVLSSITKLREDRQHQIILQSVGGESESGSLPAERLYNILRNILESILDNNHVELVRGNLYAALINFIHLMRSSHDNKASQQSDANMFAMSISHSTIGDNLAFSGSESLLPLKPDESLENTVSALELGGLAVLKPVIDRLVTTIARDAIDGTEVWKTIAFMLLDAIVQLSSLEKRHVVLSALARHGVLSNFVRSLKDSDSRLQSVLKPDPDDLNTLYVYEAKMSFFIRMGQSRPGAERLLEAQLLPILAQCDYLDTRPEADQSFLDQDSLLPSAVQRYHQLLMPALQVVDVMLATLGSKHTTATHEALNFLSNHGSTIAILLKNESESVNLLTLEEIHLIVALCTNVLPSVPKTELLSPNSGFGAIHLAILGLSARCLGQGKIFPRIVPHTEADIKLCNAIGFGTQSKFDVKLQRKERLLRKGIVSYIGGASEFTEPGITLVLSPITIMPRHQDRTSSHFAATVPTVGDTLVALEDLCSDLAGTLKQISDISAELANKDYIGIDHAQEVLREIEPTLLQNLEIDQKRSLLCQELERIKTTAKLDAKFLLATLEMLLLLIWRHIEYYAEPRHMNMPPAKTTVANAMRLLATSEPEVFQADVRQKIAPSLQKLEFLDLDDDTFGRDWQDDQGYIGIMCRRLKDSAGLNDDSTIVDSG